MIQKHLKTHLMALVGAGGCLFTIHAGAWTIAYDGFTSYQEGVPVKDQTNHGGTGFSGDWVETSSNSSWNPPLSMNTTDQTFAGIAHNGFGGISEGGRHIRTLTEVQTEGVVYASTLMLNIGGASGSNQFYIHNDTPEAGKGETGGLIGGIRYDDGILQYVDPGAEGETFIDLNPEEPMGTDILWVTKYDIDNGLISHYAYLPGDTIEEGSASYAVEDLPLIAEKQLPVGTVSIAAWDQIVNYAFVRVGTHFRDVAPTPNAVATAPAVRTPMTIDGVADEEWDNIPVYDYPLAHGEEQPVDEADASGSWKAAWDENNLYLLFTVTDDEHVGATDGTEDQVEFWTDTNFARNFSPEWPPSAYDAHDTQWITRFLEDSSAEGFADRWQHGNTSLPDSRTDVSELGDDTMVVAGTIDDSGDSVEKVVEVSVAWEDLNMAAPVFGQQIGFETQINDRDESTGTDGDGDPVFDSNGKLAWADGDNLAWRSPAAMGVLEFASAQDPLAEYAFDDVTTGEAVDNNTGSAGELWAGPWVDVLGNAAAQGTEPSPFLGKFVHGGNGIVPSGEFSVVARSMNTTFDSGVIWASMVLGDGNGTTQFWMGDASEFEQGSSEGLTAGVRIQNSLVQVIDTTLDASSPENYVPTSVTPNAPVLVVTQLDYENDTVAYWLFESGEPINPAAPAAFYEFSIPRVLTMNALSGIAVAGENSGASVSHFRIGDDLPQVIPAPENPYDCPVIVNELHEEVTVDGAVNEFAWERTSGLPVDIPWMDGGSNVLPEGPSDYTGSFHTGWFGDNLYLAVIVDDDEVLNDPENPVDSVEVYMDGDNNDSVSDGSPGYDGVDDYQLVFNLDNTTDEGATITGSWFGNPSGNPEGYRGLKDANEGQNFDGIEWAVSPTESGYILEVSMDMTVVPGLDTFLANGLMGFDVAIVDHDSTDQVDDEDNPVFAKSHHFFCDDSNGNWEATAHYGTAYVGTAEPAVVIFDDGSEGVISLAGDVDAGDAVMEITTNYTDVAYTVQPGADWITIDFDPMVGSGEMEFSWSANTGLYERSAPIRIEEATGFNEIELSQEGIAPAGMQTLFPEANPGEAPGRADAFLGEIVYGQFPTVLTDSLNWIHAEEDAAWMYAFDINAFIHTSPDLWPVIYVLGQETESDGWKYVVFDEETGSYLYDFQSETYSALPAFEN